MNTILGTTAIENPTLRILNPDETNNGYESNSSNNNYKQKKKSKKITIKTNTKMSTQNNNDRYIVTTDDLKILIQPIIPKNSSKTIYDIIMENIKKEQDKKQKDKSITRKYIHNYKTPFIDID